MLTMGSSISVPDSDRSINMIILFILHLTEVYMANILGLSNLPLSNVDSPMKMGGEIVSPSLPERFQRP